MGVAEGGVYVCRAVNVVDGVEVGSVEREATLIVIGECVCGCVCMGGCVGGWVGVGVAGWV